MGNADCNEASQYLKVIALIKLVNEIYLPDDKKRLVMEYKSLLEANKKAAVEYDESGAIGGAAETNKIMNEKTLDDFSKKHCIAFPIFHKENVRFSCKFLSQHNLIF